ncbi:unnamed protein product [Ceutorhynchus assimilis]|uniref:Uncharacterized protein n=1 Tax=Ceutorhynchus assimilis TaxID=467358 RepID=A0A9N9MVW3_9CUCU|nr:unnamed protein product [Ceutorhynchus assimilis]
MEPLGTFGASYLLEAEIDYELSLRNCSVTKTAKEKKTILSRLLARERDNRKSLLVEGAYKYDFNTEKAAIEKSLSSIVDLIALFEGTTRDPLFARIRSRLNQVSGRVIRLPVKDYDPVGTEPRVRSAEVVAYRQDTYATCLQLEAEVLEKAETQRCPSPLPQSFQVPPSFNMNRGKRRKIHIDNWKQNVRKRRRDSGDPYVSSRNVPKEALKRQEEIRIKGTEHIICRQAFCSIHGITRHRTNRIGLTLKEKNSAPLDMRGKNNNRPNKIPQNIIAAIDNHILSFPKRSSHYSREKNEGQTYLSSDLNIFKMRKLYLEKYEPDVSEKLKRGEQCHPKVTYDFYFRHFRENYNISFGSPRSDTCQTCDRLENSIAAEQDREAKDVLQIVKAVHIRKAEVFYTSMKEKTQLAKTDETVEVLFNQRIKNITQVIHQYPEPGHSFLPCDRSFGLIEKEKRRIERVYVHAEWKELVRKTSKKFRVIDVTQDLIMDFTEHFEPMFKATFTSQKEAYQDYYKSIFGKEPEQQPPEELVEAQEEPLEDASHESDSSFM